MSVTINKLYFLNWEFDPVQDTLKNLDLNTEQKLEPQVAALLLLLIEKKELVIPKQQLSEYLWPNTIVEENSVYQLLTKLRRILGDPAKDAKVIKTFPKKGYRFIALVTSEPEKVSSKIKIELVKNNIFSRLSWQVILTTVIGIALCFSAIAFFSSESEKPAKLDYQVNSITNELGLESWPYPHPHKNEIVYIKNSQQIWRKPKGKSASEIFTSQKNLLYPTWSLNGEQLAVWQRLDGECSLSILDANGSKLKQSQKIKCNNIGTITWLNEDSLIAVYRKTNEFQADQFNLITQTFTTLPVIKKVNEHLRTIVKAFNQDIFYLVTNNLHHSRLIDNLGNTIYSWPYPIKFIAFDSKNQRLITNDESKHQGIISTDLAGNKQRIAQTAQGIFSSLATDQKGDFYTSIENWQVNIRDKDNLPIFSTTTIDFLPVSNALGETVFMSRRNGFCQIYLHQNDKISQLSHFKGYQYVQFIQWSDDLQLVLTNRDSYAHIYSRKGLVHKFELGFDKTPTSFGWLNNEKIYSFDGEYLRYYTLEGKKTAEYIINAEQVYFQTKNNTWWLFNKGKLSFYKGELLNTEQTQFFSNLTVEQAKLISNIRLEENQLYWKSHANNQDHIWQVTLSATRQIKRIKSGKYIWNYDINHNNDLSIAVKENIEGDIKLYQQSN